MSGEQELHFLQTLLKSKEINALVNVHHKVAKVGKDDRIAPILSASMQVAIEILELLAPRCHFSPLCKDLFHLLQTPHLQVCHICRRLVVRLYHFIFNRFQSLLCAHDAVAQKDFYPHLPEIPVEVDEDEETIKIVQLVKSNEPLVSSVKTVNFLSLVSIIYDLIDQQQFKMHTFVCFQPFIFKIFFDILFYIVSLCTSWQQIFNSFILHNHSSSQGLQWNEL